MKEPDRYGGEPMTSLKIFLTMSLLSISNSYAQTTVSAARDTQNIWLNTAISDARTRNWYVRIVHDSGQTSMGRIMESNVTRLSVDQQDVTVTTIQRIERRVYVRPNLLKGALIGGALGLGFGMLYAGFYEYGHEVGCNSSCTAFTLGSTASGALVGAMIGGSMGKRNEWQVVWRSDS